jgi:hypothetical protein
MNRITSFSVALLALMLGVTLALPIATVANAADEATRDMARIVADLNHRPSEPAKEKLREISKTGTPAEKSIAEALIGMNHKVSPDAKERLGKIANDSSVPEDTRDLAAIVKDIHHHATAAEKQKLRGM